MYLNADRKSISLSLETVLDESSESRYAKHGNPGMDSDGQHTNGEYERWFCCKKLRCFQQCNVHILSLSITRSNGLPCLGSRLLLSELLRSYDSCWSYGQRECSAVLKESFRFSRTLQDNVRIGQVTVLTIFHGCTALRFSTVIQFEIMVSIFLKRPVCSNIESIRNVKEYNS